jgi:hypothetical protein
MQVIIKGPGQGRPDSAHRLEVGDPGAEHPLEPAEVAQQRAAFRGAETGYGFEHRLVEAAGALAPVAGDGEAVGLVAQALYQPQRR